MGALLAFDFERNRACIWYPQSKTDPAVGDLRSELHFLLALHAANDCVAQLFHFLPTPHHVEFGWLAAGFAVLGIVQLCKRGHIIDHEPGAGVI
jgi:hypothetical protein